MDTLNKLMENKYSTPVPNNESKKKFKNMKNYRLKSWIQLGQ